LVEDAQDDADIGVERAHHEGGGDVGQVVADHDEHAAAIADARLFEDLATAAITMHEAGIAEARVIGGADVIDSNDRQVGRLQVLQDAPANAAETAQDDGLVHGVLPWNSPQHGVSCQRTAVNNSHLTGAAGTDENQPSHPGGEVAGHHEEPAIEAEMTSGRPTFPIMVLGLAISLPPGTLRADSSAVAKVPILLDTDIGGDIDDALALALVLSSPEIGLHGITTVDGDTYTRALILCRLLHAIGRADIPVASGSPPRDPPDFRGQMQYGLRPAFRKRPVKERAVEFLYSQLKANPGKLTLCAIGPLTNIAELLTKHPDCKPWIKRIVLMGGAIRIGYNGKPPAEPEWNIKCDIKAARTVFGSGVPLVVAPLDATADVKLEGQQREAVFGAGTPLANQLRALFQLWDQPTPTLFDPVAVALCFDERFCKMEELRLEVDDKGMTRAVKGKPN